MKRLVCTLALLAMLIWTGTPAQADYLGELRRDNDWQVSVNNSASAGKTAVTVHYLIGRSGEKEISRDEIEIGLVEPNTSAQLIFSKPGRGVRRIIIDVEQPLNVEIDVEITQNAPGGNVSFPARMERPGSLVFDVVD